MTGTTRPTSFKASWHDIIRPTLDDLQTVADEYALEPTLIKALLLPTVRPRAEIFGNFLYIAIHFPVFDEKLKHVQPQEIDLAVNAKTLITVQYAELPFMEEFKLMMAEEEGNSKKSKTTFGSVELLAKIFEKLAEYQQRQLDHIEQDIRALEDSTHQLHEIPAIHSIAHARRNIIHFRRIVKPQAFVFETLAKRLGEVVGEKKVECLSNVYEDYLRIMQQLETHYETLSALQDTHFSFLTMRTNEAIKVLTLMMVLFLPFSLLSIIFDMYKDLPIGTKWLFIIELLILEVIFFLWARSKKIL